MLKHAGRCHFASSSCSSKQGAIILAGRGKPKQPYNQFNQDSQLLSGKQVKLARELEEAGRKTSSDSERHTDGQKFSSQGNSRHRKEYGATLQLPRTYFEIKKPGQNDELLYRETTTSELYKWQVEQSSRPTFVLHDGPPYANGSAHLGHSVNKVLKDIINRYQVLQGNRVHYVPGWDCHGLPIEQKVTVQFPGMSPSAIPPTDMRPVARQYALKTIKAQREEFKLLGIMADWSPRTTYRTLDPSYEMNQLRIFKEMAKRKLITRASKPVYWSPSSQTALAEAEVVHNPHHQSRSVYVRYHLHPGTLLEKATADVSDAIEIVTQALEGRLKINAMIWTTTPWSLTANMALTINPELSYSLIVPPEGPCQGEVFLVASDRLAAFSNVKVGLSDTKSKARLPIGPVDEVARFPGTALLDSTYRHPFLPKSDANRPILAADYVTADTGTGLVHCAPAHGAEDYNTWYKHCQRNPAARKDEVINAVDHAGDFTKEIDELLSRELEMQFDPGYTLSKSKVMGSGGYDVTFFLYRDGWMLSEHPLQHSYPYDWRTNQPLVIRATPQWFVELKQIKERAIKALEKVRFVPESARAKLEALVRSRNEWCISRQRAWGVPIPVLYNRYTGEPLLTVANIEHIIRVLTEKGSDYWWRGEADEFIAPQEKRDGVEWVKGTDTMDVWFDSGTSWTILPGVQKQARDQSAALTSPATPPANVYLEGTDQHRGWFQSSLLTHVAVSSSPDDPVAPYQTLISHAFTVDRKGDKMSKSKANVISPDFFLLGGPKNKSPAFGADPLRWWIARIDYTSDIIVSALVIRHASDELRKVRNTFRFLLSYVPLPHEVPAFDSVQLDFTEQYMMHTLRDLNVACKQAYDNYDFAQVTRRVVEYANSLVSSFYIVNVKDMLYADAKDNKQRQSAIVVLDQIFKTLLSAVGPFAPHMAEEIWQFYNVRTKPALTVENAGKKYSVGNMGNDNSQESYFRNSWHVVPQLDDATRVKEDMMVIKRLRASIQSKTEELRQMKKVKSSLGTQVKLVLPKQSKVAEIIERRISDLPRIFQMVHCNIVEELPAGKSDLEKQVWPCLGSCEDTEISFALERSRDAECPRCWQWTRKVEDKVCHRCDQVLKDLNGGQDWNQPRELGEDDKGEMDQVENQIDSDEVIDKRDSPKSI